MAESLLKQGWGRLKWLFKWCFRLLLAPILIYVIIALILTYIPTGTAVTPGQDTHTVYVVTNGLHVDLVFPREHLQSVLDKGVIHTPSTRFVGTGWGDAEFFLQTRTWADFKTGVAAKALLWPTPSLMHVAHYDHRLKDWHEITCTSKQLAILTEGVARQFSYLDNRVQMLAEPGYQDNDQFYRAEDRYTCFYTCNTWINDLLKQADLPASAWTPFDFGVMHHYPAPIE